MGQLLNNNRITAVVAGGVFFVLAAVLTQRVEDLYDLRQPSSSRPGNPVSANYMERGASRPSTATPATTHRPRTATSSVPTGTPRAIFTRTSASKGLIAPALEPGIARSNFSTESCRQTN